MESEESTLSIEDGLTVPRGTCQATLGTEVGLTAPHGACRTDSGILGTSDGTILGSEVGLTESRGACRMFWDYQTEISKIKSINQCRSETPTREFRNLQPTSK